MTVTVTVQPPNLPVSTVTVTAGLSWPSPAAAAGGRALRSDQCRRGRVTVVAARSGAE